MCAYVCVRVICVRVHMRMYAFVCMRMSAFVCSRNMRARNLRACAYACVCICVCMRLCVDVCVCAPGALRARHAEKKKLSVYTH